MYLLVLEPVHNATGTVLEALKQICSVTVTKVSSGWEVRYCFKHCFEGKSTFNYGDSYTEEEVSTDFYMTQILDMAKANGYHLFKEVE